MSKRNKNRGAAPNVSPERPPQQGALHATTGSGATKGQKMEWVRVKSEGNKQAGRARQIFQQRFFRSIRIGRLETLVQTRNGEGHYLDRLGRDLGFSWRHCQVPEAETGGEIVKGRCGVELAESMLKMHQSSCKSCRRVIDPGYTRKKRSDAKAPVIAPAETEPSEAETTAPPQKLVDEVIGAPTPMAALISEMSAQRDVALNIAAEYDGVIAAARGIDSELAAIRQIQEQMAAHRRALAAFIAAEGGPQ